MELLHGLSPEQRISRKVSLLRNCRTEALVITSTRLYGAWSLELKEALRACAARGVRVRVLLECMPAPGAAAAAELRACGAEVRVAQGRFSWMSRAYPVHSEVWIYDREDAVTVNERVLPGTGQSEPPPLRVECRLGTETARGLASYFSSRWDSEGRSLTFTVRHKDFAFHGGGRAELAFYGCLLGAQEEITLCIPGGRVSRKVEAALHAALREGIRVGLYTNADRDDGPGLRRLRRLAAAGAAVKICGRRLLSEVAVIDGNDIYLGSLPTSWQRWSGSYCPAFVMRDERAASDLRTALEAQVSVEVSGPALAPALV